MAASGLWASVMDAALGAGVVVLRWVRTKRENEKEREKERKQGRTNALENRNTIDRIYWNRTSVKTARANFEIRFGRHVLEQKMHYIEFVLCFLLGSPLAGLIF